MSALQENFQFYLDHQEELGPVNANEDYLLFWSPWNYQMISTPCYRRSYQYSAAMSKSIIASS